MKIAYCILCHKNNNVLRTLVELLSCDNDIYMHVDKKIALDGFAEYKGRVSFIMDREDSAWGSFAAVRAIGKLLRATCAGKYDYIFLVSGDDLPLKSNAQIEAFLQKNYGCEYLGVTKGANVEHRVRYLYPQTIYYKDKPLWVRIRHRLKLYKKNHDFKMLPKLYKGCLWFTITSSLRDYILLYLDHNQWYIRAFEHSLNADEVFFHTIVCNSRFKNNLYKYDTDMHDTLMSLRYIDWFSGPERPKVLSENDYEKMKASDCLFARKINPNIDLDRFKREFELY